MGAAGVGRGEGVVEHTPLGTDDAAEVRVQALRDIGADPRRAALG